MASNLSEQRAGSEVRHQAGPRLTVWLEAHADVVALAFVAAGLVVRIIAAARGFLNADEAVYVLSADQHSLAKAFQEWRVTPNPPLHGLILYFFHLLGRSDFMFRLPSVLAGSASIWLVFRWLRSAWGAAPGLLAAALLAFAPEAVQISSEVRAYALALMFVLGALYYLERAFRPRPEADRDAGALMMAGSGLMLLLAMLTHYAAALIAVALGAYGLVVLIAYRPTREVRNTWLVTQIAAGALAAFEYANHVAKFQGNDVWTQNFLLHRGQSFFDFALRQTIQVLQYLYTSRGAGLVAIVLGALAVMILLSRWSRDWLDFSRRRAQAILLILPFVMLCLAGVFGVYPYGAIRYDFFLIAFSLAGVCFALTMVAGRRLWPALLVLSAPLGVWHLDAHQAWSRYITAPNQRRELMTQAVNYLRQVARPGRIVFTDHESRVALLRYACPGPAPSPKVTPAGFSEFQCPGLFVASSGLWYFEADSLGGPDQPGFGDAFLHLIESYDLKPDDTVCVFAARWEGNLASSLVSRFGIRYPGLRQFGDNIAVFLVPVGTGLDAFPRTAHVRQAGEELTRLAEQVAANSSQKWTTILWPQYYAGVKVASRILAGRGRVISYPELYRPLVSGMKPLDDFLPALAFWVFEDPGLHIRITGMMNGRQNYVAAGYQFTLMATDPDSMVGVFEITRGAPDGFQSPGR